MTPVAHLSLIQARRLALRSLAPELQSHSVPEVVRRLGYVQIDTIAVVERAHHHVLWTRLPTYEALQLDRAQGEERQILEYWSHAAAYLPMEDYRFCLPRMAASRRRRAAWLRAHKSLTQHVVQRIRAEGPLRAADFEAEPGHRAGSWWDWKPAKLALEYLFHSGSLLVTHRRGFQKYFDLAERVLPSHVNTTRPTPLAYGRHLIRRTLECHGLATEKEITYLKPYARTAVRQAVQAMTEQGALLPVTVEGLSEIYFVQSDHLEQALTAALDSAPTAAPVRLLSPFDNLVIQRKRLQQLFGFHYQIECYVPAAKRQFGYFCLPILWDARFVGRVDPKAHRSTGRLEVLSCSVDSELQGNADFWAAFSQALQTFAMFNGCTSVTWRNPAPRGIAADA
jgi:uncharacterized protein YcaQ